ncbi:MAG: SEL1-like repeat protein [Succinivibrionaceae bacterium]|nr:SEL1-like repeat protein [Succinivibrionaceae bacterium]
MVKGGIRMRNGLWALAAIAALLLPGTAPAQAEECEDAMLAMIALSRGTDVDRNSLSNNLAVCLTKAFDGDPHAQMRMGIISRISGKDSDAAAWYQKAAAQGHAPAMCALSGMYMQGQGVPQDPQTAEKLFRLGGCAYRMQSGE